MIPHNSPGGTCYYSRVSRESSWNWGEETSSGHIINKKQSWNSAKFVWFQYFKLSFYMMVFLLCLFLLNLWYIYICFWQQEFFSRYTNTCHIYIHMHMHVNLRIHKNVNYIFAEIEMNNHNNFLILYIKTISKRSEKKILRM